MTYFPIIEGPVALYNNVGIAPQFFQPSNFNITAITLGATTVITLSNGINSVLPNYIVGQLVRIIIPQKYGTRQLNAKKGIVLSLPTTNSIEVGINSINYDSFISNPSFSQFQSQTPAQVVAIGDYSSGIISSNVNQNSIPGIPGSFMNISN